MPIVSIGQTRNLNHVQAAINRGLVSFLDGTITAHVIAHYLVVPSLHVMYRPELSLDHIGSTRRSGVMSRLNSVLCCFSV